MKQCKSCHKEIENEATKCPYCQAFQKWIKSPQIIGLIFPLIFIPIIFTSTGLWNKKSYNDYKKSFTFETVNKVEDGPNNIHTYRVINSTDIKWESISFQLIGYDEKGKVTLVKNKEEYSWVVMPNESSMISIEVEKNAPVTKWEFKIVDMRSERF
jgi:hypothetical protein